jgi:hypothetical protein
VEESKGAFMKATPSESDREFHPDDQPGLAGQSRTRAMSEEFTENKRAADAAGKLRAEAEQDKFLQENLRDLLSSPDIRKKLDPGGRLKDTDLMSKVTQALTASR